MMYPVKMSKLVLICPGSLLEKAIGCLHKQKVVHIETHRKGDLDIGSPLPDAPKISELLLKIRSICASLAIVQKDFEPKKQEIMPYRKLMKICIDIEKQASAASEELKKINQEINDVNHTSESIRPLISLPLAFDDYRGYDSLSVFTGFVNGHDMDDMKNEIKGITEKYGLYRADHHGRPLIALFIESSKQGEAQNVLSSYGFTPIIIPENLKGSVSKALKSLEAKALSLNAKKEKTEKTILSIKKKNASLLVSQESILSAEIKKAEIPLQFAASENVTVIKGWVPSESANSLRSALSKALKGRFHMAVEEPKAAHDYGHEEDPSTPVKLSNPKASKPFEFLLELFNLPSYHELDPTFFLSIIFPIFFGFMLGDLGYGLVIFLACRLLLRKFSGQAASIIRIIMISAVSTMFFGLVFGEFFGFEEWPHSIGPNMCRNAPFLCNVQEVHAHGAVETVYSFPHLLSRTHEKMSLLVISLIIGAIHINFSLILGFWNIWKSHGLKHAFLEKISWLILEIAVALLALTYMGKLSMPLFIPWAVLAISILLIYLGEGTRGLVELPAIFSNMLSYARLMAIGLSSVGLAIVVNDLTKPFFAKGVLGVISGLLIFAVGHGINIGLGILGPFLHSLRLHYVEFFSRFFKGGGVKYSPFGEESL